MTQFVHTNQLPTQGDLYLSTSHQAVTDIVNNTADATLKTAILGHTWKPLGIISQFQVSHIIGDEVEKEALNCGVGVYSTESELNQDVTTTLLELNNLDIFKDLIGGDRGTVANDDDVTEILKYTNGKIVVPMNAVLFVSCPYKIDGGTEYEDMEYARDIIVASKQAFTGELIERYVLGSETFEGSEVTLSGKKGGKYAKLVLRGKTLADVAAVVTQ